MRGADVARGTHTDAMWHARPRGRATRAHAAHRCRGCPGGTTWREGWQVKGPRVSGLWLVYWGGNARALFRPTLYTRQLPKFLPCGAMFPRNSLYARHVAEGDALDTIASNGEC